MKTTYDKDDFTALLTLLEKVPDPRSARGVRYRLSHLLLICVYAVLSGYTDATEISFYAEITFEYFRELIGIKAIPSHDTFSRILRLIDFNALSGTLGGWLRENFPEQCLKYQGKKVLHVDGKAVRAAAEKSNGEPPVYHLNAMYEGESVGVEIYRVGSKENEISCLPEYLKRFCLKDTIVTMDAIGCNRTVIEAIQRGGGNYVLPVKENQKRLHGVILGEIERLEKHGEDEKGEWEHLDCTESLIKKHGRIEKTTMHLIKNTAFIYEKLGTESFFGTVARIGVMDKTVETKKNGEYEKSKSRSLFITDLEEMEVETMLQIRAAHWNIEMQHWILDIQLREDRQTARRNDAVTNGAILRRFCMAMKKKDKTLSDKPLNRFLMSNAHNPLRVEEFLFGTVAGEE